MPHDGVFLSGKFNVPKPAASACIQLSMKRRLLLIASIFAGLLGPAVLVLFADHGGVPVASGPFARAWDFLSAARSVDGLAWWSPTFFEGTSLASDWSFLLSNALLLVFGAPMGIVEGPQTALLACMALGAAGSFWFLRRYTGHKRYAAVGAALFLLCPSLLTHAAGYGHFSLVCAMAVLPWALLGLHFFLHSPSPLAAMCSAATLAAMVLAGGKTGIMGIPVVVLFGVTQFFGRPVEQRPTWRLIGLAGVIFFLLAVVPNLPALREAGFSAQYEFAPFAEWQHVFSTKSALGLVDRQKILTEGMDAGYAPTTSNGGTYPGLVLIAFLALALFKNSLHDSLHGRQARTVLALGLFSFWLSFGPAGVLGGHLAYLNHAVNAPDFAPALAWFFLAVQVWVIFQIIPPEWPGRKVLAGVLSLIYLGIPGFRLLEFLPIYKNIRAPFDFYQASGAVCIVFAAAIVIRSFLTEIRSKRLRAGAAIVIFSLAILDVSPYAIPFFKPELSRARYDRFLAAQVFLKSSPLPGRVFPFSGRSVHMLTPVLSGRPLVAGSFDSQLQQRGAAILQGTALASDDQLLAYLRIAGVSHLVVDKSDPDTPRELQDRLRKLLPSGFENDDFLVLENKDSLGFGFQASEFLQATTDDPQVAAAALSGARYNLATIRLDRIADESGLRGKVVGNRLLPVGDAPLKKGPEFQPLAELPEGTSQHVSLAASGTPGWTILNQAWHPDWRAFEGSRPAEIHRAFLGFSAVRTRGLDPVTFRFEPPWWYPACALLSLSGWIACGLLGFLGPFIPNSFHRFGGAGPLAARHWDRVEIRRALVVIPTYNEATGIRTILERTLALSSLLEILVVDDGSPDGTADIVRALEAFGTRVHLLERRGKLGLGNAYNAGFAWAKEQRFDAVIEMDADLSHDPADIPRLIAALNAGADAAVGSRYIGGVRVINWPEHRLMLSAFASKFVRFVTGLPLTDATSGFKALRIEALNAIPESAFKAQGYGFQIELHHALWKSGANIVEVPIVFTERRNGQTKMNAGIAVEAFTRVLQLSRR